MANGDPFVDYYEILQVSPTCSERTLETAFHTLAKKYHPDHADVADVNRLTEVIEAYKALKDPSQRTEYNQFYTRNTGFIFSDESEKLVDAEAATSDADAHAKILMALYKKRRELASDPGIGQYAFYEILNCSEELVEFHIWYLKEKGFIEKTEQGTLAITIEGVDHVISQSRATMERQLLLSQSNRRQDQRDA